MWRDWVELTRKQVKNLKCLLYSDCIRKYTRTLTSENFSNKILTGSYHMEGFFRLWWNGVCVCLSVCVCVCVYMHACMVFLSVCVCVYTWFMEYLCILQSMRAYLCAGVCVCVCVRLDSIVCVANHIPSRYVNLHLHKYVFMYDLCTHLYVCTNVALIYVAIHDHPSLSPIHTHTHMQMGG